MRTLDNAPPRILVAYAGAHGHTERLAQRVVAVLDHEAVDVELLRLRAFSRRRRAVAAEYDGVIVCASVRRRRHQAAVRRWLARHRHELNACPTALLWISGTTPAPQPSSTNWRPSATLQVSADPDWRRVEGFVHRTAAEIRARAERGGAQRAPHPRRTRTRARRAA